MAKIGIHGKLYKMKSYQATIDIILPKIFAGKKGYVIAQRAEYLQVQVVSEIPGWCYIIQCGDGMYSGYEKRVNDIDHYMSRIKCGCILLAYGRKYFSDQGTWSYSYDLADQILFSNISQTTKNLLWEELIRWSNFCNMDIDITENHKIFSNTIAIIDCMIESYMATMPVTIEDKMGNHQPEHKDEDFDTQAGMPNLDWERYLPIRMLPYEEDIIGLIRTTYEKWRKSK